VALFALGKQLNLHNRLLQNVYSIGGYGEEEKCVFSLVGKSGAKRQLGGPER
jgi:hypothetical protein